LHNLLIYPNPTSGQMTIDVSQTHGVLAISITNAVGNEVDRLYKKSLAERFSISLDGPSGVYTVTVIPNDGPSLRLRVLKQ